MSVLATGHHLHPASDGTWLCATPGDRFVRLSGPEHVVKLLQESAHTGRPIVIDPASDDAELSRQLIELLEGRGILEREQAPAPARLTKSILIDGDTPVAEAVANLLSGSADVTVGIADESSVSTADVVVSCAGWLPDARWTQLQSWCTAHRTAWHRCHAEGDRFFVGPLWTADSDTADYQDVRARRLAASGVADHLAEYWHYLDDPDSVVPPVRWPNAGGIALIAGIIATEVATYVETDKSVVGSVQLDIEPTTAQIIRHPVLPIPLRRTLGDR